MDNHELNQPVPQQPTATVVESQQQPASPVTNQPSIKKSPMKMILIIILILAVLILVFFMLTSRLSNNQASNATINTQSPSPVVSDNSNSTTDKQLEKDTQNIDSSVKSLDSDVQNVDQSLNDKPEVLTQ